MLDNMCVERAERLYHLTSNTKSTDLRPYQILLQVPAVSRFQWHPFTISTCIGSRLQVHIKADGDWTDRLHKIATEAKQTGDTDFSKTKVGIDGPFGAPAQRFYSFDKSLIMYVLVTVHQTSTAHLTWSIAVERACEDRQNRLVWKTKLTKGDPADDSGVTPFSACLTDLEENFKSNGDPWKLTRSTSFGGLRRTRTRTLSRTPSRHSTASSSATTRVPGDEIPTAGRKHKKGVQAMRRSDPGSFHVRRTDFHWMVREKNDLLCVLNSQRWSDAVLTSTLHLSSDGSQICSIAHKSLLNLKGMSTSLLTSMPTSLQSGRILPRMCSGTCWIAIGQRSFPTQL